MIARCRSCGAEVIWTITEHGKRMPVDAEIATNGNIFLDYSTEPPTARYVTLENVQTEEAETRFLSHFVSCPESKEWRKSG